MQILPLFPLGLVVYPGEKLNLHIFEPRYQELIKDCHQTGINFGITAFVNKTVMTIGTEMSLLTIDKTYPSGESDISVVGNKKFQIIDFFREAPGKKYAAAKINWLEDNYLGNVVLFQSLLEKIKLLHDLLHVQKDFPKDHLGFSYKIAHYLGLSLLQEYQLLELETENDRLEYLNKHIDTVLPIAQEIENLKSRVKMNGHFRDIQPPNF